MEFPPEPNEVKTFDDLSKYLARYPSEAHHPTCKFHHNHLVKIWGKDYCLGCWCLNLGCIISIPLLVTLYYFGIPYYLQMLIGFLMFTPTLLQIKFQWKPFKLFSRTSLGIGSGLFLLSSLILSPISIQGFIVRVLSIGFFVTVAKISLRLRSNHSKSPCIGCSEGSFPYCSYKITEMKEIVKKGRLETMPHEFLVSTINNIEEKILVNMQSSSQVINDQ